MRIEVEPQELIDAGKGVGSLGTQLGALSDAMGEALADGIASGADAAGLNFGISYGRQADEFGKQLAQLANAFKSVGLMLEATGFNYKNADAGSTPGGPGPTGSVSGEQPKTNAGDAPYAPNGNIVPPPSKWWTIQPFLNMIPFFGIAMTWPTGNAAMMNLTAAQWANIGRGLKVFEPSLTSAAMAAGAQDIPEVGQIKTALKDLGDGATKLAQFADQMASTINEFAAGVQETQDAIRSILDRLSLDGLWDTVKGVFSGDGLKIMREIADDIGDVLGNFQDQVKGVLGLLEELKTLLGEASDAFEKWIRPILVETFGEEHGNFLADAIDFYTDVQVGGASAVIGLVSGTVALADPDTWKGLADTAIMIAKDPTKIDDVLKQVGSEFIALDEWQGDNPGRGLGEATGNIASLFLPGGPLAKGGSVAKGLAATRHLLDGGSLESLGRLPGLGGGRTPDVPEVPDAPGVPHVPEFTPPPAGIPGSVLGPNGSGGPSAPSPSSPSAPSGPGPGSGGGGTPSSPSPNGSGPSQTGGGASGGGSSGGGPAPVGGSPSGGSGPSSNGPVPTGGSSASGGDGTSSGAQSSPSTSSPSDSPGSGGSSSADNGGPSKPSDGGGPSSASSSGDGSSPAGDSQGSAGSGDGPRSDGGPSKTGDGPTEPSSDGSGGGTPAGSPQDSGPSDGETNSSGAEQNAGGNDSDPSDSGSNPGDGTGSPDNGHRHDSVHSVEENGDGWRRIDDKPDNPNYGRPLEDYWESEGYPTPTETTQSTFDLIEHPDEPYGHDGDGIPLTKEQYDERYNLVGPEGQNWENYPPNDGAVPGSRVMYDSGDAFLRDYGQHLDRIGPDGGSYLGVMPEGLPPSFESRGLPISSLNLGYDRFSLAQLPDNWSIEVSEIAPAFGRDGGALQVLIYNDEGMKMSVKQLIKDGVLE